MFDVKRFLFKANIKHTERSEASDLTSILISRSVRHVQLKIRANIQLFSHTDFLSVWQCGIKTSVSAQYKRNVLYSIPFSSNHSRGYLTSGIINVF